jgi:hypothetical protein
MVAPVEETLVATDVVTVGIPGVVNDKTAP